MMAGDKQKVGDDSGSAEEHQAISLKTRCL